MMGQGEVREAGRGDEGMVSGSGLKKVVCIRRYEGAMEGLGTAKRYG